MELNTNKKKFELENNTGKKVMTEKEVYALLLPSGFTSMLMRMAIGDSMFHYDTMTNFKRIQ